MSMLTIVQEALRNNPDIVVACRIRTNLDEVRSGWAQVVQYVVSPLDDLLTPEDAQAFMMGLTPLTATGKQDCRSGDFEEIHDGLLYFDEKVGEMVSFLKTTVTDSGIPLPDSFVDGIRTTKDETSLVRYDRELRRRTLIRIRFHPEDVRRAQTSDYADPCW